MKMTAQDILKTHFSKTINLSEKEFDYVFTHFKPMSLKKGQSIINLGDTVNEEYFVLDGCIKTFYLNDEQKMFILQFAMKNWWASDYNALYLDAKATVTLDCVIDSEVLCLSNEDREKLCKELYPMEYFFRWRSNKGYVAAQKRLLSLMNNDVKYRYEELMHMYPQLYNIVPKQLIAAYLGVSRETLSRLNHKNQ
ncbi:Crp/Fnr family transcriptional regulator [Pedobacter agri]|uniref:Crp/Fnr family transcriptional regulator n=1 Tax=Pedobacter agri TaxID=454586 RepID=UPI00292EB90E|nr:Crp/Fnr family transcriptional regulator [Pedobacter agri]